MNQYDEIRMSGPSGLYQILPDHLDDAMAEYLPASIDELRVILAERVYGSNEGQYDSVDTVTGLLVRLADCDKGFSDFGNGADSPWEG